MEFSYDCLMCHVNQARRVGEMVGLDEGAMETAVRRVLKHMSEMSYSVPNPATMAKTWEIIAEVTGDDNPYREIKKDFNEQMLSIYDPLYDSLKEDPDKLIKGIHLAVEGNIIDFGAKHSFSKDDTVKQLTDSEKADLVIDESEELAEVLTKADRLLYIGDNCGEIVMDKLMIKLIGEACPDLKIIYAVRGKAVLNDVTTEDANQVGMSDVAEVISNGSGAPGTVLDLVSEEFREIYDTADVIISKGQGNFESLSPLKDQRIYFLFMAKCETVAEDLGVAVMSKLCVKGSK